MTLTQTDLQAIKEALKPDFATLNKKIDSLKRSNRKEHNLIIKVFDEKNIELKKRVARLEDHAGFPPFKSL